MYGYVMAISMALISVGLSSALLVGYIKRARREARDKQLLGSGRRASGVVVSLKESGPYRSAGQTHHYKDIRLELDVSTPDGRSFRSRAVIYREDYSRSIAVGQTLKVRYDGERTDFVAVEPDTTDADELAMLERMMREP